MVDLLFRAQYLPVDAIRVKNSITSMHSSCKLLRMVLHFDVRFHVMVRGRVLMSGWMRDKSSEFRGQCLELHGRVSSVAYFLSMPGATLAVGKCKEVYFLVCRVTFLTFQVH